MNSLFLFLKCWCFLDSLCLDSIGVNSSIRCILNAEILNQETDSDKSRHRKRCEGSWDAEIFRVRVWSCCFRRWTVGTNSSFGKTITPSSPTFYTESGIPWASRFLLPASILLFSFSLFLFWGLSRFVHLFFMIGQSSWSEFYWYHCRVCVWWFLFEDFLGSLEIGVRVWTQSSNKNEQTKEKSCDLSLECFIALVWLL